MDEIINHSWDIESTGALISIYLEGSPKGAVVGQEAGCTEGGRPEGCRDGTTVGCLDGVPEGKLKGL